MSLGLPFWSRSYMCCGLTVARMSLPIYQLVRAYCFQLVRAYCFSSLELTVLAYKSLLFSARQSLPFELNRAYCPSTQEELTRFVSSLVSDKSELHITLSNCRLPIFVHTARTRAYVLAVCDTWSGYTATCPLALKLN
ncbi:Breakpoint cluster region [Gossypium arboreum]|uniref:Breakpoint cluster region n=1 Tax=Gossypium arboreum TaxID=29729 RepID=A0A0B0MP16_GOSAR|nr:Breakpoint cluster region [Gossypium arboreum]